MNVWIYCKNNRLAHLICTAVVSLVVAALPALAADEAKPSGPGGSGIISGDHCFKTGSKTVTEVCADYKVSWKLWTLMGEPVGDYRLRWELKSLRIGQIQYGMMPPELANAAKSIELYLDAVADTIIGGAGVLTTLYHPFNTGVGTRAGQLSYNTPGSPKWSEIFYNNFYESLPDKASYMSEEMSKQFFAKSKQPDNPIILTSIRSFGPKSSISGLDALEGKIAELCSNPKTAPSYQFCPPIKEKPKKDAEDKMNPIDDAFSKLGKAIGEKPSKSRTSIDDAFSGLDKGKATKTGQGIDAGFEDVEEYRRQLAANRAEEQKQKQKQERAQENKKGSLAGTTWQVDWFHVHFNNDGTLTWGELSYRDIVKMGDGNWTQTGASESFTLRTSASRGSEKTVYRVYVRVGDAMSGDDDKHRTWSAIKDGPDIIIK